MITRAIKADDAWLKWKEQVIGASEIGAVFHCHDHLTYYQLYHMKRDKLKTEKNKAMEDGLLMQEVALKMIQRDHPEFKAYDPRLHYSDADYGVGATPDVFAQDANGRLGVIQIKHVDRDVYRQKWLKSIPTWIALQVTQEAWLTEAKWGMIAALVHDHELQLYLTDVEIHNHVIDEIKVQATEFWRRVREGDEPEPNYRRDSEAIREVLRQDDGSEIDLSGDNELPEILHQRAILIGEMAAYEKELKAINAELLHRLGTAQIGRLKQGYISAKTIHRKAYEVAATSYRQLRVVTPQHGD